MNWACDVYAHPFTLKSRKLGRRGASAVERGLMKMLLVVQSTASDGHNYHLLGPLVNFSPLYDSITHLSPQALFGLTNLGLLGS